MRQFFAKLLQTSGEPTNLCFVKDLNEVQEFTNYHWREWVGYETYDKENQNIFTLEYFLCSRDIEYGDSIYIHNHKIFDNLSNSVEQKDLDFLKNLPLELGGWYKTIGQVSSEITSIKEMDIFDESDLLFEIEITINNNENKCSKLNPSLDDFLKIKEIENDLFRQKKRIIIEKLNKTNDEPLCY